MEAARANSTSKAPKTHTTHAMHTSRRAATATLYRAVKVRCNAPITEDPREALVAAEGPQRQSR